MREKRKKNARKSSSLLRQVVWISKRSGWLWLPPARLFQSQCRDAYYSGLFRFFFISICEKWPFVVIFAFRPLDATFSCTWFVATYASIASLSTLSRRPQHRAKQTKCFIVFFSSSFSIYSLDQFSHKFTSFTTFYVLHCFQLYCAFMAFLFPPSEHQTLQRNKFEQIDTHNR